MKVLRAPSRLRLACALLLVSAPLAAWEVYLHSDAPYWVTPWREMILGFAIAFGVTLPLALALMRGWRMALPLFGVLASIWALLTAWLAVRSASTGLGFFDLLLSLVEFSLWLWIGNELRRSYLDPRMRWFEGIPRALPGLRCRLQRGDEVRGTQVARLDRDGAYVFWEGPDLSRGARRARPELLFNFRDREIRCKAEVISRFERGNGPSAAHGVGLRFFGLSADVRKELGDFIEILRGEGYE